LTFPLGVSTEEIAQTIVKKLVNAGHVAYFAGGWVRDYLLGHPSADIDIATSASPEEVMGLFEKTIPVGVEFGSVIVVEEGEQFEVTSFRTEGAYLDGRHPSTVAPGTAEEDAKRRSFTINGMFYDPLTTQVIDFVGGQEDLKKGIIRAIGNPAERFEEDKLRMIRALRFSTCLGFTIEPRTAEGIRQHAGELLPAVAVERIWQEFQKMTGHQQFGLFLLKLHHHHLLEQIFPELSSIDVEQRIANLAHYPDKAPTIAYLTALFPMPTVEIGQRLKVSKKHLQFIERQIELSRLIEEGSLTEWVHFYALDDAPILLDIQAATEGDAFLTHHEGEQMRLASHIQRLRNRMPLVTSAHLQALGISPGPKMGKMLRKAEQLAIENNLNDADAVLALLQNAEHN
jgi:poly(A) polymerase